ncbi:MAG: FAD-binding oxidoreductase [Nocardioides sp.]|uniref:NAD(P)/FAD-dependent oxidoreductase n=1 Tax=Nocardioides sp. TaxID=35761 RepID=UPI0039E29B51
MGCALKRPYAELSWWHSDPALDWTPRRALPGDLDVDIAIVGAGFTGLWTAYYLAEADPSLRIAVVEREVAGFGASGRNGGWCSALFPASADKLLRLPGATRESVIGQHRAMCRTVDEVGRVVVAEGIDADYAKGGTVVLARTATQLHRAQAEVAAARAWGHGEDDLRLLDADQANGILRATQTLGGTYTPHCAAIHPAKLVRGLADAVARRGAQIFEQTRVLAVEPGIVRTERGAVRAETVIRATEGYTASLAGQERALVPVYSMMIASEPLPAEIWDQIGLRRRETFSDFRHLIIYGQRTADDRLAFGGRGAPYHFGSTLTEAHDRDDQVFASIHRTLLELFPVLRGTRFTHAWGGALGVPRDWCASVGLDPTTRVGWAGGYVGDGVGTTNLSGRTLRDLILGEDTELTRLPWVNHHSPPWEPEPLRWLGINSGLGAMTMADHEEHLTRRESLTAKLMAPFLGH